MPFPKLTPNLRWVGNLLLLRHWPWFLQMKLKILCWKVARGDEVLNKFCGKLLKVTGLCFRVGGTCYHWKFKDCNRVSNFYQKRMKYCKWNFNTLYFEHLSALFLKKLYQKGQRKKSYKQSHWKDVNNPKKSSVCEQKYFKFSWSWEIECFEKTTELLKSYLFYTKQTNKYIIW